MYVLGSPFSINTYACIDTHRHKWKPIHDNVGGKVAGDFICSLSISGFSKYSKKAYGLSLEKWQLLKATHS